MTYELDIRQEALDDISRAAAWYEDREAGLGRIFVRAIRDANNRLLSNPLAHRVRNRRRGVRWLLPASFPYRIVYRLEGQTITIVAVIHSSRHDREWKKRL